MSFEPLQGWREVVVSERRTQQEFAHSMRRLAEEHYYSQAEKIRVVLDNLSTHTTAAFYESFPAEVARENWQDRVLLHAGTRLVAEHGVEIEISVLVRQCLGRRLPDVETLGWEAQAWCTERNNRLGASVDWRFRTEDARIKLRSLYPSVKE